MTDEQILELVKEHFKEGGIRDDGSCSEYYGDLDAFVKFAKEISIRIGIRVMSILHTEELKKLKEVL